MGRFAVLLILVVLMIVLVGLWTEQRTFSRDYSHHRLYHSISSGVANNFRSDSVESNTSRSETSTTISHKNSGNDTLVPENNFAQGKQGTRIIENATKEHNQLLTGKNQADSSSRGRVIKVHDRSDTNRSVVVRNNTNVPSHHNTSALWGRNVSTDYDTRTKRTTDPQQKRFLLLRNPLFHGHANQQQCLHLASVLAVQYNRTLLLPSNAGCRPNKHQHFPIPMERLYNVERAKRLIDYQELSPDETTITPQCHRDTSPSIPFSHFPNFKLNASDPFGRDTACIVFDCEWADTHMQAPKSIFPNVDQIYFRYHDRYWDMGHEILKQMTAPLRRNTTSTTRTSSSIANRVLGIQIRRGDRFTWPLLNCGGSCCNDNSKEHNNDDPLRIRLCRRSKEILKRRDDDELMWNDLFQLLPESAVEANATTVDAIFVATNDANYVHALKKRHGRKNRGRRKLAPLYMMAQFIPQIRHLLLPETRALGDGDRISSAVEILLIEQIVLTLAGRFIPSFPSTVPDHVFRMRLSMRQNHSTATAAAAAAAMKREQEHYDLYDFKFANHFKVMDQKEFLRQAASKRKTKNKVQQK